MSLFFSGHVDKPYVAMLILRNGCVALSNLGVKGHIVVIQGCPKRHKVMIDKGLYRKLDSAREKGTPHGIWL